jgi:hypothetical protein
LEAKNMASFQFNAANVEPDAGRVGAIPAGWYPVSIDDTEIKPTSGGSGLYLNTRYTVLDGPYKGCKIWHKFNTKNDSDKAVEIGYKQLSALMHAVNVLKIDVTEQLHNIPLFVKVKFVPPEGQYDSKNEITAFRSINDEAAKAGFKASLTGGAAAPAAKIVPPPVSVAPAAAAGWNNQATAAAPAPVQSAPVQTQAPAWNSAPTQPWNTAPNGQTPSADTATVAGGSTVTQTSVAAPAPEVAQQQANWANAAPVQAVQVQQTTTAQSQESTAAVGTTDSDLPPWMQ